MKPILVWLAPAAVALLIAPALTGAQSVSTRGPNQADDRIAIMLTDDEVAFIRREMRGLLESVRDILEGASAGDRARIVAAGRRAGMNGPESEHIPKSLAPKLPQDFKKLGLATHRGFDQIAQAAENSGALDTTPKQLAALMENCVSCHATWRVVGPTKP